MVMTSDETQIHISLPADLLQILRSQAAFSFAVLCIIMFYSLDL